MSYDNAKACAVVETTDTETRSNLIEPPTHHIQTEVTIPKYPEDSHFGGTYMYLLKFYLAPIGVWFGGSLMFLLPRERPRRKTHWKWHWLPIEVPQTQGRRKRLGGKCPFILEQRLGRYYFYARAIFRGNFEIGGIRSIGISDPYIATPLWQKYSKSNFVVSSTKACDDPGNE